MMRLKHFEMLFTVGSFLYRIVFVIRIALTEMLFAASRTDDK